MRAAARRGMWGLGVALLLAACGEPSTATATGPAPTGDPAAQPELAGEVALLAVVEGKVTVRDAQGVEVEARPDMPLSRADTVITTPGSLAVVVLANGYVLKLEEDQATPVRALAHLDDPPPSESVAELFEQALGAEAFARVGGAGRIERIAGWNARRASGETPAPVAKADARAPQRAPAEELKAEEAAPPEAPGGGPARDEPAADEADGAAEAKPAENAAKKKTGTSTPPPPPSPVKKPSQVPKDTETAKRGDSIGGAPVPSTPPVERPAPPAAETDDRPPVDLVDSWIFETGPNEQVTRTSLPEPLKGQRKALAQCVAEALPGVPAPELRLRVAGGVVKEVALGGGKPAPACARGLVGRTLGGVGDGWMIGRVRR